MRKVIKIFILLVFSAGFLAACSEQTVTKDKDVIKYPDTKYDEARCDDSNYRIN